jgi:phospholipid transport system substrate-binding protein
MRAPRRGFMAAIAALTLAVAVAVGAGPARAAGAGATAESAAGFVRALAERAEAALADPALTEERRAGKIRALLTETVDIDRVGRFVLGKHMRRATDEERAEYRRLFRAYLLATYGSRLDQYAGERLEIGAARLRDERRAVASSRIVRHAGPPVQVDWQLLWAEGRWKVVDVVVEGVSLAMTQRSEFGAAINAGGGRIDALLARLREKTPTLTAEAR